MKRILTKIAKLSVFLFVMLVATNSYAQLPDNPTLPMDDPSLNGTNGAVGHPLQNGGASVDGGMNLFLLFAMAYGVKRYFQSKKKEEEKTPGILNE